ncbi:MAG TPA: helix-turn-helix domain-containing protein [Anaeromyxobacter sp.]|nr:helix-turn-helix domain-containing protein [Anaeromyxobacter sp.]
MERETGFEPATLSLGSPGGLRPAGPEGSQPFAIPDRNKVSGASLPPANVQPFTAVPARGNGRRAPVGRLRAVDGNRLLTVRDAARVLGVSTATVYALCDEGRLAHVRVGNAIRVRPADLEAFTSGGRS